MKIQLEQEVELKSEGLSLVTRQITDVNAKYRDLALKREGIMSAKEEHLKELVEKDLRGLELMYAAQMTKKREYQYEVEQATRSMEGNDLMLQEIDDQFAQLPKRQKQKKRTKSKLRKTTTASSLKIFPKTTLAADF